MLAHHTPPSTPPFKMAQAGPSRLFRGLMRTIFNSASRINHDLTWQTPKWRIISGWRRRGVVVPLYPDAPHIWCHEFLRYSARGLGDTSWCRNLGMILGDVISGFAKKAHFLGSRSTPANVFFGGKNTCSARHFATFFSSHWRWSDSELSESHAGRWCPFRLSCKISLSRWNAIFQGKWAKVERNERSGLFGGRRKAGHWVGLEGVNLNATNNESNGRLNDGGEQLRTRRSQEGAAGSLDSPSGAAETKSELIWNNGIPRQVGGPQLIDDVSRDIQAESSHLTGSLWSGYKVLHCSYGFTVTFQLEWKSASGKL